MENAERNGFKGMWDNIEEYDYPHPLIFPFYLLKGLKRHLAELDKNAVKSWNAIEDNEKKIRKFIDIALIYKDSIVAKRFCSNFDDNETILKKMDKEKRKEKKCGEKIKHRSELIEKLKTFEKNIETGMPPERVSGTKRNIDNINKEIESIECYVKKNKPIAYIYDGHERNRAVETPTKMIEAIKEMIKSVEQFEELIQNTNEKLAYLFKYFYKIKYHYD